MSIEILQDIIDNFNPDKFSDFFREKNRNFSRIKENLSQYNDDKFIECTKIGEINFESDNTFFVLIKSKNDLTEKAIKKLQYEKAKKILKDQQADSGIFIFYDKNGSFRFSLVYADYTGKREWSSFKRFTYFVKKEITNKTFIRQIGTLSFDSLKNIKDAFSVDKVTKEFYRDVANWYFWAVDNCKFPVNAEEIENGRNIAVIRLITRMIFIWFMKELKLVPENLFHKKFAAEILNNISDKESSYYKAVLQNLFFATLSTPKEQREFANETKHNKGHNDDFGNQSVFRFHELFKNPGALNSYFNDIPYLNGGLFECLDRGKENYYIDGFTRRKEYQPLIPNILFFGKEHGIDLNKWYGTEGCYYEVKGLLEILSAYNFTVDENTSDDADVALDPELLGKVFENLLANFNPETSSTARKATGSFYTPREIVDYMVTESLREYFKTHLSEINKLDEKLDLLFNPLDHENPFADSLTNTKNIVSLIENVKIVDPAVGSGAFPMGILNKLVFILNKVDKGNKLWKEAQIKSVENIQDSRLREQTMKHIENYFENKNPDYGRKLYLIQRCIYGVDIQQIAVEISKLRFFISLLIDEKIDKEKPNWNIEPLPNLDFKIMQGNSLLEEYDGIKLFDESLFKDIDSDKTNQLNILKRKLSAVQKDILGFIKAGKYTSELKREYTKKLEDVSKKIEYIQSGKKVNDNIFDMFDIYLESNQKRDELTKLHREYFDINEKSEKDKIKKKIEQLEWEFIESTLISEGQQKKLDEFDEIRKSNSKPFFLWKLHFPEVFSVGGFDIVIGNPPYIRQEKLGGRFKDQLIRNHQEVGNGIADLYVYFFSQAIRISKKETGVIIYITLNKYLKTKYGLGLRNHLRELQVNFIIDFFELPVFEAGADTAITQIINKESTKSTKYFPVKRLEQSNLHSITNKTFLNVIKDETEWKFVDHTNENLLYKVYTNVVPLAEFVDYKIYRGITTGLNKVFIIPNELKEYIDNNMPNSNKILSPYARGTEFNKFIYTGISEWFINSHNGILMNKSDYKLLSRKRGDKEVLQLNGQSIEVFRKETKSKKKVRINRVNLSEDFPFVFEYLLQYKDKLVNREDQGDHWSNLRNCDYIYEFIKPKIIYIHTAKNHYFYFDTEGRIINNSSYMIVTDNLYVWAFLNSKLFKWLKKIKFVAYGDAEEGGRAKLDFNKMSSIPIRALSPEQQKTITDFVEKMFSLKKNNPQSNTESLEERLDLMIYRVYDLTYEDVKIVDPEIEKKIAKKDYILFSV